MPHQPLPKAPLRKLLTYLPQELYDEIQSLTFSVNKGPILIDYKYKPPVIMQVSRATRELAAAKFYSNTFYGNSIKQMQQWIASLSLHIKKQFKDHRLLCVASRAEIESTEGYQLCNGRRHGMIPRNAVLDWVREVQWVVNAALLSELYSDRAVYSIVSEDLGPFLLFLEHDEFRAEIAARSKSTD